MSTMTDEEKQVMLDMFGDILINHVRDVSLTIAMGIAKGTTVNPIKQQQYASLRSLGDEQKEAVCDLLSETIKATIYNFLDMFEAHEDKMKLIVKNNGIEYDLSEICEKMGGEIAFMDEHGWIQKFSKVGRFV